ncbi:MAG: hypothetical protein ACREB8_02990 [Pseudolabrys sp.]
MFRQTQISQIFTVFGSFVLEGDYYQAGRSRNQIRCDARKAEFNNVLREARQ